MARHVFSAGLFALGVGGALAVGLVACGSSSGDDGATSANDITARDAGTDAPATGCVPCADRFAAGKKLYDTARRSCFCADDVCHESCTGSLCAHDALDPDATCKACVDSHYDSCVQVVEARCEANADCTQYVVCKIDSACN